jgi:chemotaxis family two-component system response regulator Rcp1
MAEPNTAGNRHILVVEDNDADVFLLQEAVSLYKLGVELHVVENGALAIAYIENADNDDAALCPCLCLLDMNLPLKGGAEVLRCLRASSRMAEIPAIVMTSSRSQLERDEIMRLGASAFFHKPISYSEFMDIGKLMRSLLPDAKTN